MIRVENPREVIHTGGMQEAVLDIQVSTGAELPTLRSEVSGYIILPGSIANVIQTGGFYELDDDGTWYNTDGTGAYSEPAALSMAAPSQSLTQPGDGQRGLEAEELPTEEEPQTDERLTEEPQPEEKRAQEPEEKPEEELKPAAKDAALDSSVIW